MKMQLIVPLFVMAILASQPRPDDETVAVPTIFRSETAKKAIETFSSRLKILDNGRNEQIEEAKKQLRADLEKAAEVAVTNKDFSEVKRISSYLESKDFGQKASQTTLWRTITDLKREVARLNDLVASLKKVDPIVGVWNYNNGNVCEYLADGTVILRGSLIAIWRSLGNRSYIVAFTGGQAADRLQVQADWRTILLIGPDGSRRRLDRVSK
ncbi:MAG: hypothetical protein A2W31_03325 [Planctomycetes bacterium RBG_16_64_10]|nr:MAG: hypothetical protein A2W31_03325 [Planctomycetes bacterium RBG_16_64_10]